MNSNNLKAIFVAGAGLFLGFILMANVLTSGGNVVSNLYRYIPFVFAIAGFIAPTQSLYLLSICVVGIGYLKKTMILDGYFAFSSLYFVVGAPAILMLGMCASTFVRLIFSRRSSKRDWSIFMFGISVTLFLMAVIYLKSGRVELAVMTGAYANILWVLPLCVRDEQAFTRLLGFTLVLMLVTSSVGYYQAVYGLTELDRIYVELGYADESEGGAKREDSLRPFATYGSPNAFGWSMLFAVVIALNGFRTCRRGSERIIDGRKRRVSGSAAKQILWLLAILLAIGAILISTKKAPILGLLILPFAAAMIRTRIAGLLALCSFSTMIFCMIRFPDEIRVWCRQVTADYLVPIHPALTLNTVNTRLKSFEVLSEEGTIAWFGTGNLSAHSHTFLTTILQTIGYIPFFTLVVFAVAVYWFGQRKMSQILGSWKTPRAEAIAYDLGFFVSLLAGALTGTNVHQSFPASYLWWLAVAFAMVRVFNQVDERARGIVPEEVEGQQRQSGSERSGGGPDVVQGAYRLT